MNFLIILSCLYTGFGAKVGFCLSCIEMPQIGLSLEDIFFIDNFFLNVLHIWKIFANKLSKDRHGGFGRALWLLHVNAYP